MPSSAMPLPGDWVYYNGRRQGDAPPAVCSGLVAEVMPSPLTGKLCCRIVDCRAETRDPGAGRWVDATDLIPARLPY